MFLQLGAAVGDELDDLFPGSGAIGRAWALFVASDVATTLAGDLLDHDAELSRAAARDVSRPAGDDGFELVGDYVPDEDMHLFLLPEQRPPLRSRLREAITNLQASLDADHDDDAPLYNPDEDPDRWRGEEGPL
jgi:hypothetical protein